MIDASGWEQVHTAMPETTQSAHAAFAMFHNSQPIMYGNFELLGARTCWGQIANMLDVIPLIMPSPS